MVKRCAWGLCTSDSRYPSRLVGGVYFVPFPKPKSNLEKCKRWIVLCGRPAHQLSVEKIDHHIYVCSKHFIGGNGPSSEFPHPLPAKVPGTVSTWTRPPPKKRRIEEDETHNTRQRQPVTSVTICDSSCQTEGKWIEPIDILYLTAENERLKQELGKSTLLNDNLHRKIIQLEEEITLIREQEDKLTANKVKSSNIKNLCQYYTGFAFTTFLTILSFLLPNGQPSSTFINFTKKISSIKEMSSADQLLLVLMKLRKGFHYKDLAFRFCLSPQDVGIIFKSWINFMYFKFNSVPIWPHRNLIIQNMPPGFREEFPTTMAIFDGTEIKIQRPSALTCQSQSYSDYKATNTLKGLVGVDPRGAVIFISTLFSGSISDKAICNQGGLISFLKGLIDLGHLERGDSFMLDKGVLIEDEMRSIGLQVNIPPFAQSNMQMSESDEQMTRKIAKHRVHVERAISRIKNFRILSRRIDLSMFTSINQIWFVCAFLTNFQPFLIQDKD
ncbi:uncharacterized protein LOC144444401 [Glandiceps talaboti]